MSVRYADADEIAKKGGAIMGLRAAIYTRISSAEKDDRTGVLRHAGLCQDECERRGWEVVDTYEDNNISAKADRPAFNRLMADLFTDRFDIVVAYEQSRLARDDMDWLRFRKAYAASGLSTIQYVRGGSVDLSSAQGGLTAGLQSTVNAYELEVVRQRILDKHQEIAEVGGFHGGRRPFGYDIVDKKLVVNDGEAVLVKAAASIVLSGGSLGSIARDWNEAGVSTVKGGAWAGSTVRRVLQSHTIAGIRVHKGSEVSAQWEGILDESTWRQVAGILRDPGRRSLPARAASGYPLRGILRCAEHGGRLEGQARNGIRQYQSRKLRGGCGLMIRAEVAERMIAPLVVLADDPRLLAVLADTVDAEASEGSELLSANAKANETLENLGVEIASLAGIPAAQRGIRSEMLRLQSEIDQRNARLSSLRGSSALDKLGGGVAEAWPEMSSDDQRLVLMALVESIAVEHGRGSDRLRPIWAWQSPVLADVLSSPPYGFGR